MVFSANTQETLGISYEGVLVGAMPIQSPNRLSYTEMYDDIWKYDQTWTSSYPTNSVKQRKTY